jgi:hypothetical protein
MGIFDEVFDFAEDTVNGVFKIATAPVAIALGVSEALVKQAVRAGCKTQREIREWIEENT